MKLIEIDGISRIEGMEVVQMANPSGRRQS
jgi:hypothetical protein